MTEKRSGDAKHSVRAHVREFSIPPIHDALVLGRDAPIGCKAFRKALDLLMANPFEHIELNDDTISDILVRATILRRLPPQKLIEFVIQQIKPLMTATEVLHLDLDVQVTLEDQQL
jgi:hypothetical protein